MEWNAEKYIDGMQVVVQKFVSQLKSKGIDFSSSDGNLQNVVFTSNGKTVKMSKHSFYRYSGISCVCEDKGGNLSETVEVTDEMYFNIFIKPIIEIQFK